MKTEYCRRFNKLSILLGLALVAGPASADLWMAGDSTMCDYKPNRYPQWGWGQALALFMNNPAELHNLAVGGRSAKSFKAEGRWQKLVDSLKPGDFVIVAFGHNDATKGKSERYSTPEEYKALMTGFANDVKAKGASLVFATSIPHSGGVTQDADGKTLVRGSAAGIGPYVKTTLELGKELGLPILDLNKYGCDEFPKLGKDAVYKLYMRIAPDEYKNCPKGKKDGCHIRDTGAFFFAKGAVTLAKAQNLPIAALFKDPATVTHEPIPYEGPKIDEAEAAKAEAEAKAKKAKRAAKKPNSYLRKTAPISQTNDAPAEVASAPLFRKTIAVIGDSYVQNHKRPIEESWHYRLAEKYQMNYLNYGRNGNTVVLDRKNSGTPVCKRYKEIPADVDYLVVIGGHNDAFTIARLGGKHTVKDTPETLPQKQKLLEDFKTRLPPFLDALKSRFTKAKIVYVTPWGLKDNYFPEVIETIKSATAAAGIACYDAASLSGIDVNDEAFRVKFFQTARDTAHLNAAGHAKMLEKVEPSFLAL